MSSFPPPEFQAFLRHFIRSHASTIFAAAPPSQDHDDGAVEPLTFTIHSILQENPEKQGPLPASKSAIEALPTVNVTDEEDCAICLTEYGAAGEVKEMPCKHRYHSDCIMKWLDIHGSCPVCRYEMPVDEEEKRRRGGGVGWQVMFTVTRGAPVMDPDWSGSDSVENSVQLIEDMDVDQDGGGNWDQNSMEDLD